MGDHPVVTVLTAVEATSRILVELQDKDRRQRLFQSLCDEYQQKASDLLDEYRSGRNIDMPDLQSRATRLRPKHFRAHMYDPLTN